MQLEEDDSLSSIISDSLLQENRTVLLSPLSHGHVSMLRVALAVPHYLPSVLVSPSNSSFLFSHYLQNWANSPHKEAVPTSLTQAKGAIQPITPMFPARSFGWHTVFSFGRVLLLLRESSIHHGFMSILVPFLILFYLSPF